MSMGYRRMAEPDTSLQFGTREYWGKPFANSLIVITVETKRVEYCCWFKGANDKMLVWDRQEATLDDALARAATPVEAMVNWLKYHERYHFKSIATVSEFHFLTRDDEAHIMAVMDVVAVE